MSMHESAMDTLAFARLAVPMTETQRVLALLATLGTGLSAGVFFAFSTFVMPALHALPARTAVTSMQSINRYAPNPLFLAALFVPLALGGWLCVALRGQAGGGFAIAATACTLVGLVVLLAYHVPHNDALATVDPGGDVGEIWRDYYGGWTAWNHVRTVAFTAATTLFALSSRA